MYISTQPRHEPLRTEAGDRAVPVERTLSTQQAIALYVLGIFVETLGLALVAAYGWWITGAAIAATGLKIATFGNRAWPAPAESARLRPLLPGYLTARSRRHQPGVTSNDGER